MTALRPSGSRPGPTWNSSEAYASRFAGAAGRYMLSIQEQGVLRLLSDLPGDATVLEVGGGHAQLAGPVARQGRRVTVLGSTEACRVRLEFDLAHGRVAFMASDFGTLPFAEQSFDAVLSVRLILMWTLGKSLLPRCAAWRAVPS